MLKQIDPNQIRTQHIRACFFFIYGPLALINRGFLFMTIQGPDFHHWPQTSLKDKSHLLWV
jgi:hypothetical protein